jgi:hypothetical protein
MTADPRGALRRMIIATSACSWSWEKVANIGTDFSTVVETEVDAADMLF